MTDIPEDDQCVKDSNRLCDCWVRLANGKVCPLGDEAQKARERSTGKGTYAGPDGPAPTEEKLKDGQHKDHWVLSEEERAKGFVRPVRSTYMHGQCLRPTSMPSDIAETFARDPTFYSHTFCSYCKDYFLVKYFTWFASGGEVVGS